MRVMKLPMNKLRVFRVLVVLALAISMSACSLFHHKRDTLDTMPVDALYNTAHDSMENSDYAAAVKAYQRLIARFPSGPYNEQAQIDLTYAQYKDNQMEDAYSTINRFIKTYPANNHIDYAYYLRGLINFDRTSGVIERYVYREAGQARRDQGYNLQAFDDFSELTRRYPDSAYAADARQRMIYLRNSLAQFEIDVAKFYLRNKAYVASFAVCGGALPAGAADRRRAGDSHPQLPGARPQGAGRPDSSGAGAELSESPLPDRPQVAACAVDLAQDGTVLRTLLSYRSV